jgi:DNA modification methylase
MTWRIIDGCLVNGRVTITGCDARAWDVALQVEAGSVSGRPGEAYRAPLTDKERAILRERTTMQDMLNQITTGDARELAERIPDESVDLIFTDPVYERIEDYAWLAATAARVLKPNSAALVFCGIGYLPETLDAMRLGGLHYRWQGLWYQSNNMQRADMGFCNYSPFLWFEKGRSKVVSPTGDVANVPIPSGKDNHNHRWNKRPELIARYLKAFSRPGALVWEPFAGGGTIPAVCKMHHRNYIAFEIDPATAVAARERVANTQPMHPAFVADQSEMFESEAA